MKHLSVKEVATKLNLSEQYIRRMCGKGLIEGCYKISHVWAIPESILDFFNRRPSKTDKPNNCT